MRFDQTNMHKYDDMLDMEHPTSKKHTRMAMQNRAAQFAPFAALTGFEEALKESSKQRCTLEEN